jgi:mRNA interferase HicA
MNSNQFRAWLRKRGCRFEKGKGGHVVVRHGKLKSILPTHGGRKQLGKGLISKIKKDLGLR